MWVVYLKAVHILNRVVVVEESEGTASAFTPPAVNRTAEHRVTSVSVGLTGWAGGGGVWMWVCWRT